MAISGSRYQLLDKIGQGGMGTVYQAQDRLTGQIVALKQVSVSTADLQFASKKSGSDGALALAQEFRLLAGLRHPHIVAVLDYGFVDSLPFYTMELLQQPQTITRYGAGLDETGKVDLLVHMLQALAYLHRRGIIHRDLKPGNVLVLPDGVLKVMDFGLALQPNDPDSSSTTSGVAGTLAYMAPEIFSDQPASQQSDLYAVGVIAYELFVGAHPFGTANLAQIVNQVMTAVPDTSMLPWEVADVLDRLLAKDPDQRYRSAGDVIEALCAATEQPSPPENAATRESFLQASAFVGRQPELDTLRQALQAALAGSGSAWLIGGESGVGKSRLMEEIRTRSLVAGTLVLRGQAVTGGGLPYQMWRDPLRRLILSLDVSDMEASILKPLLPDIADLIGRPVPDIDMLAGKENVQRLSLTIVALLNRCPLPLVLLLEDLQWAEESLIPLKEALRLTEQSKLLVIATYRDDEKPDLPSRLPEMHLLKLARFSDEAIRQLSASMLGEAGTQSSVVDLLKRETEGNAFFMVEVVRALAEEAGSLAYIGSMTLPGSVVAGGVRAVIQRRLGRVPESAHPLLRLAAVAGRQIDLRLLQQLITSQPGLLQGSLDDWLSACADAAVLDIADGVWRFSHDKLREVMLLGPDSAEQSALHRQIALGLEAIYPDDSAYAEQLANHWYTAGDQQRTIHYSALAAKWMVRQTAEYSRACTLLARALPLADGLPAEQASLHRWYAAANDSIGNFDLAHTHYDKALSLAQMTGDSQLMTQIYNGLSRLCWQQGQYDAAQQFAAQAQAAAQASNDLVAESESWANLGVIAEFRGDLDRALACHQRSLELDRENNNRGSMAGSFNNLGVICMLRGNYQEARDWFEQSLTIKYELDNRYGIGITLSNLGNAAYYQGAKQEARGYMERSLAICREIGDRRGISASLNSLGVLSASEGNLLEAQDFLGQGLVIDRELGDQWGVAASLINIAGNWLDLDDLPQARRNLHEALVSAQQVGDPALLLEALVVTAHYCLKSAKAETGAHLAGLVDVHPATYGTTRDGALQPLLPLLEEKLGTDAFTAALEHGRTLDLDTMVQQMLAELQADLPA